MSPFFHQKIKTRIALQWVGLEFIAAVLLLLHVHWLTTVTLLYLIYSLLFSFRVRPTAGLALILFSVIPLFVFREEPETARELALAAVGFFGFALMLATRAVMTLTILALILSPLFLSLHQPALSEDLSIAAFFLFAAIVLFELKGAGAKKDQPTPSSLS